MRRLVLKSGVLLSCVSAVALASDSSTHSQLLARGLVKKGSFYLLPSEVAFSKKLGGVKQVRAELAKALQQQDELERSKKGRRKRILNLINQRRKLSKKLSRETDAWEHNRLIARMNELTDSIELLSDQDLFGEQEQRVYDAMGRARQAYVEQVLALRGLADAATAGYSNLAADPHIEAALAELSQNRKRPVTLGPRRNFAKNLQKLQDLESAIETERIQLHSKEQVLWVDVVINGKDTRSMIFDTGAAMVVLPAEMAAAIGVKPSDQDDVIYMTIADGRTVEAKRTVLDSVRIGDSTVKKVDCVVMPANLPNAPPLLGGTFLRHFIYSVDPHAKTLTLSRVESGKGKK